MTWPAVEGVHLGTGHELDMIGGISPNILWVMGCTGVCARTHAYVYTYHRLSRCFSSSPLPLLNCELQRSVGTAGPQPRALDISGHCQTSNHELQISVGTAGPQARAPDLRKHCQTSTASSSSQWVLPDLNRELQRKNVRIAAR